MTPVEAPSVVGPERPAQAGASASESWAFVQTGVLMAVLLPTLVAAVVFGLYFQAQSHWLADPDAQDYAQLGRQIAAGRGPTTYFMPWNGLDFLARRDTSAAATESAAPSPGAPPWPNVVRFPLTPALMAFGFAIFGPGDEAAHLPAGLAFILTAGCAGLLGARVYGSWPGLTAGLAAATLPLLVNYSLTGLTEPLLGLLILGVLTCVLPPSRIRGRGPGGGGSPSPRHGTVGPPAAGLLVLGGTLFGLAILTRYDTALLALPILALWLLPRPDRWRASGLFLGPAFLVVLPWAAYLTVVAGSPLFNLQPGSIATQAAGLGGGLGWYWPHYLSTLEVWLLDPWRALRLGSGEMLMTPDRLRKAVGLSWTLVGVGACLVAAVRWWRGAGPGALLGVFLVAAVLLRALTVSVVGLNLPRYYVPLAPLLLVVVAGEALWLARASIGWLSAGGALGRTLLIPAQVAVALLLIVPGLWTIGPYLIPPTQSPGPPSRAGEVEARPENLSRLAEIVGPSQVVASNVPWSVAWQADRHAVPLPPTVEATGDLERRFGLSVDAIYVAGQVAIADAPRSWRAWDDLRRSGAPPPGYVLAESFQNGGRLFVKAR
jgi:4-amino-4-deoxy-L-arabinose transferase-like glycosyltransferase